IFIATAVTSPPATGSPPPGPPRAPPPPPAPRPPGPARTGGAPPRGRRPPAPGRVWAWSPPPGAGSGGPSRGNGEKWQQAKPDSSARAVGDSECDAGRRCGVRGGHRYAGDVGRNADREHVPAPMRRDVRLLGDLLGEVLRESGGQELLDDVARLRRAAIAARQDEPSQRADDEIASLVASWPIDRAEAVARAFTVYFHLANLAEEHQRIRTLRARDSGTRPVRESLAAAVADVESE